MNTWSTWTTPLPYFDSLNFASSFSLDRGVHIFMVFLQGILLTIGKSYLYVSLYFSFLFKPSVYKLHTRSLDQTLMIFCYSSLHLLTNIYGVLIVCQALWWVTRVSFSVRPTSIHKSLVTWEVFCSWGAPLSDFLRSHICTASLWKIPNNGAWWELHTAP